MNSDKRKPSSFYIKLKAKWKFFAFPFIPHTAENRLFAFMGRYGKTPFPYPFILKYRKMSVDLRFDQARHLPYVMHHGYKLYLPANFKPRKCLRYYKSIISEQDPQSPHRYVPDYTRLSNKTLLDIGAAEGIFALDVIDKVKHVYLFECEPMWQEALKATFEPWTDKVSIISAFVGDGNDSTTVSLDHFLKGKDTHHLFLKMDIEGAELSALQGAKQLLQQTPDLDFSICTYHRPQDASDIRALLKEYMPTVPLEQTEGYMYFDYDFRRAIIRRDIRKADSKA